MKKFVVLSTCVSMVALSPVGWEASAFAETLQDAVQQAVTTHPTMERAAIGTDIAKEDITEERSGFFPSVSANFTGGRLYGDNSTSRGLSVTRGVGYSWLWEGNASVNQMVFDWNQTSDRVESASAQRMAALHTYEDAKQTIAYQAVQGYIALYKAQILHEAAVKHLAEMQDYKDRIIKLVEGGGADEAEASRARDLVLAGQNILSNFKGQLKAAEANYKQVVGELPDDHLAPPLMPFAMNTDADIENLIEKIQSSHPQIQAVNEQIEAMGYTAEAESKDPLPKLNSELSYTKRDQRDIIGGESVDARAMLRLNWNLDTGGAQFARAKKARLEQDDLYAQREEIRRSLERNIRVALASFEISREQRDIQKQRHDELTQTVKTYKQQFEASKRRLLEVAQVENELFAAKTEYLSAQYDLLDAAYGFLMSQGSLTDAIDILAIIEEAGAEERGESSSEPLEVSAHKPYSISEENRPPHRELIKVDRERPPLSAPIHSAKETDEAQTLAAPQDIEAAQEKAVQNYLNKKEAQKDVDFSEAFTAQQMEAAEKARNEDLKTARMQDEPVGDGAAEHNQMAPHTEMAHGDKAEAQADELRMAGHGLDNVLTDEPQQVTEMAAADHSAVNKGAIDDGMPAEDQTQDSAGDVSIEKARTSARTEVTDVAMAPADDMPAATAAAADTAKVPSAAAEVQQDLKDALDNGFADDLYAHVSEVFFTDVAADDYIAADYDTPQSVLVSDDMRNTGAGIEDEPVMVGEVTAQPVDTGHAETQDDVPQNVEPASDLSAADAYEQQSESLDFVPFSTYTRAMPRDEELGTVIKRQK